MKHYTLFAVPILFTWTIFCHADIRFTNSTYIAQVSAAGYINRINYPLGSPDHIAGIDSVLYHSGGSTWLSMFSVLADVGLVGNVATSYVANGEAAVAIRTVFHDNYIEQQFTVRNITNVSLNQTVFSHYQDGDLTGGSLDDLVGRNWQTRMLYQTDSNVWIGMCMYASYMRLADYYMGGYFLDVRNAVINKQFTQALIQTNDTAIAVGILYATLFPGQSFTMTTRTLLSSDGVNSLVKNALPYTTDPSVKKMKFSVNFAKPNKDTLSFAMNLTPPPLMITSLVDSIASIYIGEYIVIDETAISGKVSKRGTMAVYGNDTTKVKFKINAAKRKATVKAKIKNVDIGSYWHIQNNGQPGTLELPVLFYLNTTNLIGHETVTVPYSNKQDKKAKGKQ